MQQALSTSNPKVALQIAIDVEKFGKLQLIKNQLRANNLGSFVSVGLGAECQFNTGINLIQDAINSGAVEIRVVNDTAYTENLIIDDMSVSIRGGFDSCIDANNNIHNPETTSHLSGELLNNATIVISGDTQMNVVYIEHMTITDGNNLLGHGGGIEIRNSDSEVQLSNLIISNNHAYSGGGIGVSGVSNTSVVIVDTDISDNTGNLGGGMSCDLETASFTFIGNARLNSNRANNVGSIENTGFGGGGYITEGCKLSMYSERTLFFGTLTLGGITNNKSERSGGGIYADSGAEIYLYGQRACDGENCLGSLACSMRMSSNRSDVNFDGDGSGGGFYLAESDQITSVYVNGVIATNNGALGGNGGFAYINQNTSLEIEETETSIQNVRCNYLGSNDSSTTLGSGGAIYNNNGNVSLGSTYFYNNRADFGTVIYSIGENAITKIYSSILESNGNGGNDSFSDIAVVSATLGARTEIVHTTIADNNANVSVLNIDVALDTSLLLHSSIIHDVSSGSVISGGSSLLDVRCLMVHEDNFPTGEFVVVDDPEFVDRTTEPFGDYHLNAAISPAIDFCDNNGVLEPIDIDYDPLGSDDPEVSNFIGPYDLGADETYQGKGDLIFRNSFEIK